MSDNLEETIKGLNNLYNYESLALDVRRLLINMSKDLKNKDEQIKWLEERVQYLMRNAIT